MTVQRSQRSPAVDIVAQQAFRNPRLRKTAGLYTNGRDRITTNSLAMTTQLLRLAFFDCLRTETVTQIRSICGAQVAGATPTICKMALFDVDDTTGNLSGGLVTTNDTAMWNTLNTAYTKNLPSSKTLVAGKRYAAGALCVTAAAVPFLIGCAPTFYLAFQSEFLQLPVQFAAIPSQTDIATSYTYAQLGAATGGDQTPMFVLL